MTTQFRPFGSDGPLYSPQRDLAYIYAPAMKEALTALDRVQWTEEIRELIGQLGITEADIALGVERLVEAHKYFVNDSDVDVPVKALIYSGWYATPTAARYLIYGRLGEVILGGFFLALRDVTQQGKASPQAADIADFIAAGVGVARRLRDVPVEDEESVVHERDRLKAELVMAKRALSASRDQVLAAEVQQLQQELAEARKANESLKSLAEAVHDGYERELARLRTMRGWVSEKVSRVFR